MPLKRWLGKQLVDVRNFPNLNKSIEYYQDKEVTLVIPSEVEIQGHLVIPQNITTKVLEGGKIKRPTGTNYTLRIEGKFQAPAVQIFENFSAGDVIFGREAVEEIKPHWFGDPEKEETIQIAVSSGAGVLTTSPKYLTYPFLKRLGRISVFSSENRTFVSIKNNYIFAIEDRSSNLYIIDISSPNSPQLINTYNLGYSPKIYPLKQFVIKDDYLFIALCEIEGVKVTNVYIKVLNISDPNNITEASFINVASPNTWISTYISVKQGYYVYLGIDKDLYIIDFTNFSNPQVVNTLNFSNDFQDIYSTDNYLYIAIYNDEEGNNGGRLYVYNISQDPTNPQQIGHCSWTDPDFYDICGGIFYDENNNLLFISNWNSVVVIDVSDFTNPIVKNFIKPPSANNLWGINKDGDFLYIVDYKDPDPSEIYLYDIVDLENPQYLGAKKLNSDETKSYSITIKDNYAYVTSNTFLVYLSTKTKILTTYYYGNIEEIRYNANLGVEKENPAFVAVDKSSGGVTRKFASSGGAAKILSEADLEIMNLESHASRHAKDGIDKIPDRGLSKLQIERFGYLEGWETDDISIGTDNAWGDYRLIIHKTNSDDDIDPYYLLPLFLKIETTGTFGSGEQIDIEINCEIKYILGDTTDFINNSIVKSFTGIGTYILTNEDWFNLLYKYSDRHYLNKLQVRAKTNLSSTSVIVKVYLIWLII